MEILGSGVDLSSGYKLVPWSNWDQWNFVRDSIFSCSPDSVSRALHKITAWRSRGCLPVPIDVTAAIVEIQQKDPEFRAGAQIDALNSEELLAMLYCMAIMRLVNCFVEPAHKKTGRPISHLANAIGIPRTLVDIRHESSHRNLPSLRLVRMASKEAIEWLKSNYWEPQRRAIPDVRKEIRSRLREMSFYLKSKHAQKSGFSQVNGKRVKRSGMLCNKLSLQIAGKLLACKADGFDRKISRSTKLIARLYSSHPSQVAAELLEFFNLQAPQLSDDIDKECSDDSSVDDPGVLADSVCDLKSVITRLSNKKPELILGILKTVIEMVEAKESALNEMGDDFYSSKFQSKTAYIHRLCSLVHWLLLNLKASKDSDRITIIGESSVISTDSNTSPSFSLTNLLQKILSLVTVDDMHLSRSALLLAEMLGNKSLIARLKKIPLPVEEEVENLNDSTFVNTEIMLLKEEASLKQATEELEILKSRLKNRRTKTSTSSMTDATSRKWTVAKSWIPCPIGMLPCSFNLTAALPDLDLETDEVESKCAEAETNAVVIVNDHASEKEADVGDSDDDDENTSARKRLRVMREEEELDLPEISSPMKGLVLINGVWEKVREEDLINIEQGIEFWGKAIIQLALKK